MKLSGKIRAVCMMQDAMFPDSSVMFGEVFDSLFDPGAFTVDHHNIQYWASKFIRNSLEFDYIVYVDFYSNVVTGILAVMSGATGSHSLCTLGRIAISSSSSCTRPSRTSRMATRTRSSP